MPYKTITIKIFNPLTGESWEKLEEKIKIFLKKENLIFDIYNQATGNSMSNQILWE